MPFSKKKILSNKKSRSLKKRKFFYIIRSKYLDKKKIKDTMKSRQIWEEFNISKPQKENPDFILVDQHHKIDKDLWDYKTKLRSVINIKSQMNIKSYNTMNNKYELVNTLKKLNDKRLDKMLLEQHHINLYNIFKRKVNINKYQNLFDSQKVWIFKFIYGHSGINIIVLDNFNNFKKFVKKIINQNFSKWENVNFNKKKKYNYLFEWVLQEYVHNPALYENKKFHIRGYYLFHNNINKKEGFIFNNGRIAVANKEYSKGDYKNKDIHDTHFYRIPSEKKIFIKPHIYGLISVMKIKQFEKDLKYLFNKITKINKVKCYSNDESCYNLYGFDIMLTSDFKIKLIECNLSPGLPPHDADLSKINHPYHLFDSILECIVDKKFISPKKILLGNKFIKVY